MQRSVWSCLVMGWRSNNVASVLTFIEMKGKPVNCRMDEIPTRTLCRPELNLSPAASELPGLRLIHHTAQLASDSAWLQTLELWASDGQSPPISGGSKQQSMGRNSNSEEQCEVFRIVSCVVYWQAPVVDTHICLRTIWWMMLTGVWWSVYKRKWGKNP